MKIVATEVHPNEPCMGLFEGAKMRPIPGSKNGAQDWRWIQMVFVVRGDTIASWEQDLGHADLYEDIQPIFLPNDGTDSVAILQAYAEKNRNDTYWAQRAKEQIAESTLFADIIRQNETLRESVLNRSNFGPYQRSQRNGYSLITAEREVKKRRQERTGRIVTHG